MEPIRHELRLSETVSPYGVGAIVDVLGASLVAPDTSWWDKKFTSEVFCDRLLARLGAGVLRQAPTHAGRSAKESASLTYWRFPAWRFCERCGKVSKLTGKSKGKWSNKCDCNGALVPMRYVAVCTKGSHLQDIPWFKWTHRGHDSGVTDEVRFCKAYADLELKRDSKLGEGLKALRLRCTGCKRTRSMAELVVLDSLSHDGIKCQGTQPWIENSSDVACEHKLVAVQRGATSNYIAERLSALDIPEEKPQSEVVLDQVKGHVYFEKIIEDNGGPQAQMVANWIAKELDVSASQVLEIAANDPDAVSTPLLDLKDGEWAAFINKLDTGRDRSGSDFVVDGWRVNRGTDWPASLTDRLTGIGQVRRVREVRALRGFRRYNADAELIPADLGPDKRTKPVYPAIEMYGEGIFLRFDEDQLQGWENLPEVRARAQTLIDRRDSLDWSRRLDTPEPRLVALHSLAHLLIRRLSFDSGYSSASLQERIYANTERADNTAGILIYTAAGDAQGTLGGLVRLGAPERMLPLLISALDDADVCSNDPVCIESDRQGATSLNLAACHGCSLISETSCEYGNRFLDRQMVIGGSNVPGLLGSVLSDVRAKKLQQ